MTVPYERIRFDWLVDCDAGSFCQAATEGDVVWQAYPLDDALASGGFEKLHLAMGMAFFQAKHDFTPAARGRLIPLANIEVIFSEPTFMVQTLRGGRVVHREQLPPLELAYGAGLDLFRHASKIRLTPLLDGSSNSEMISLSLGSSVLDKLIGPESSAILLAALNVTSSGLAVRSIPPSVNMPLWNALPVTLTGPVRKLHCQARVLDYLTLLANHVGQASPRVETRESSRVQALRDYLLALEGKLPALDELAVQFGRSARTLNADFNAAYGKPIVAFVTEHRLQDAHRAILETQVPLKVLAARLGYSHVNHFNTAFRKNFGYPPGSLRKIPG